MKTYHLIAKAQAQVVPPRHNKEHQKTNHQAHYKSIYSY